MTGLLLHEGGIVGPCLQQAVRILRCHVELVDERDRAGVLLELLEERNSVVHLRELSCHMA